MFVCILFVNFISHLHYFFNQDKQVQFHTQIL